MTCPRSRARCGVSRALTPQWALHGRAILVEHVEADRQRVADLEAA